MGYFSNGTEQEMYVADYCDKCVHGENEQTGCPVMNLHWLWNYDAVGEKRDEVKHTALDTLIPRDMDGWNQQCTMFHAK